MHFTNEVSSRRGVSVSSAPCGSPACAALVAAVPSKGQAIPLSLILPVLGDIVGASYIIFSVQKHGHPSTEGRKINFLLGSVQKVSGLR